MICYKCKKELNDISIYRTTECPFCGADLHVCKACKFYSPGSHYDCKETIEDIVSDKERANFCDFFKAGENGNTAAALGGTAAQANIDAFNALFKD